MPRFPRPWTNKCLSSQTFLARKEALVFPPFFFKDCTNPVPFKTGALQRGCPVLTHSLRLTKQPLVGCSSTVERKGAPWKPRSRKGMSNSTSILVMLSTFSQKLLNADFNFCRSSRSAWKQKNYIATVCQCLFYCFNIHTEHYIFVFI